MTTQASPTLDLVCPHLVGQNLKINHHASDNKINIITEYSLMIWGKLYALAAYMSINAIYLFISSHLLQKFKLMRCKSKETKKSNLLHRKK